MLTLRDATQALKSPWQPCTSCFFDCHSAADAESVQAAVDPTANIAAEAANNPATDGTSEAATESTADTLAFLSKLDFLPLICQQG